MNIDADDFLIMPQMMMNMGRLTKGMPVEYRPVPMIAGTRKELEQLVRVSIHYIHSDNVLVFSIILILIFITAGSESATRSASIYQGKYV